jgi:CBS domain-containing protein
MRAKDIMHRDPIKVGPNMTLKELAQLFIDSRISGVPVVDRTGNLLGVVSQTDLVRRDREMKSVPEVPGYYRSGGAADEESHRGYQVEDPDYTRVSDVMTPAVIAAKEETPVEDLAKMMLAKHIHRIIITKDAKLTGIVTSMDMLRALLAMTGQARGSKRKVKEELHG